VETWLQLTVAGLSNGMVYALAAVGFVVIYKASDVINFAQGELLAAGAYLVFLFAAQLGLAWPVAVPLTLLGAAGLGLLLERLVLRRLIGEPVISTIMVTIGLSTLLRALMNGIWGARPLAFPSFLPGHGVSLGPAVVSADRLLLIPAAGLLFVGLGLFFRFTRDGIAMRAIADDQQAALSMGISARRVLAVAWAIAAVCAALGGIALGNIVGVSQDVGRVGLRIFPVVILGGLDSVLGAVVGGAVVGLPS